MAAFIYTSGIYGVKFLELEKGVHLKAEPDFSGKLYAGLPYLGFLGIFSLFCWYSLNNFISHSELWSIHSGRLLGMTSEEAMVVYYKPLFYSLLKIPHFFPVKSVTHILIARFMFALLAGLYTLLIAKFAYQETRSKWQATLYVVFLLSFHAFTYNIFRVRADLLAEIFIFLSLLYVQKNSKSDTQKSLIDWKFFSLLALAFLSTPKAIFSIVVVLVYKGFKSPRSSRLKQILFPGAAIAFSTFSFICIGGFLNWLNVFVNNPYSYALVYFGENLSGVLNPSYWVGFSQSLKINFLHYLIILLGLALGLRNFKSNSGLLMTSLCVWILFLLHSEKWDYYLGTTLPLLSLPALFVFERLKTVKQRILVFAPVLFTPFFMTFFIGWYFPNKLQLDIISKLEAFMTNYPEARYFDSTGLLPQTPSINAYIGYNDHPSLAKAVNLLEKNPPEFIFYTTNIDNRRREFEPFLHKNYTMISSNLWVNSSFIEKTGPIPWEAVPFPFTGVFIYDIRPRIRFFNTPPRNS